MVDEANKPRVTYFKVLMDLILSIAHISNFDNMINAQFNHWVCFLLYLLNRNIILHLVAGWGDVFTRTAVDGTRLQDHLTSTLQSYDFTSFNEVKLNEMNKYNPCKHDHKTPKSVKCAYNKECGLHISHHDGDQGPVFPRYWNSHVKDMTVARPSYR